MGTGSDNRVAEGAKMAIRKAFFCVMSLALGLGAAHLKIFEMNNGGAITLCSLLIISLPSYWYGPIVGVISGTLYGCLQFIMENYIVSPVQVVIDYGLAFAVLGLAGVFYKQENGLIKGYILAVIGRYYFLVMSGWLFYSDYRWEGWSPLGYSLVYNGIYTFAEMVITLIILLNPILGPKIEEQNKRIKLIANGGNPDDFVEE